MALRQFFTKAYEAMQPPPLMPDFSDSISEYQAQFQPPVRIPVAPKMDWTETSRETIVETQVVEMDRTEYDEHLRNGTLDEALKEATAPPVEIPEPETLNAIDVLMPETVPAADIEDEYATLVDELGMSNTDVQRARLARWLQKEEIVVYDRHKVESYLLAKGEADPKFKARAKKWNADMIRASRDVYSPFFSAQVGKGPRCVIKWPALSETEERIPVEALRMAKRIKDGCGMEIDLKVSKVEWNIPEIFRDPFLSVSVKGDSTGFIVFKWDEPGFTVTG